MTDDFSDYPVSLTEDKANRTLNCADWKPRDALIDLLRQIDSGQVNVDALMIAYREVNEDGTKTRFNAAVPDIFVGLGLLTRAAYLLNDAP